MQFFKKGFIPKRPTLWSTLSPPEKAISRVWFALRCRGNKQTTQSRMTNDLFLLRGLCKVYLRSFGIDLLHRCCDLKQWSMLHCHLLSRHARCSFFFFFFFSRTPVWIGIFLKLQVKNVWDGGEGIYSVCMSSAKGAEIYQLAPPPDSN